jgi:hypothetical protein
MDQQLTEHFLKPMKMNSRLDDLMQELQKYSVAHNDEDIDNPMTFIASIGINKMMSLVQEANATNSVLAFSYNGRKLAWKFAL